MVFPPDESHAIRNFDFFGDPATIHRNRQPRANDHVDASEPLPVGHFQPSYDEIDEIRLTIDEIQSGFAVGGSTAAQKFPVPALRLALANGDSVLLDRGSFRKLSEFGKLISERLGKSLAIDPQLTT